MVGIEIVERKAFIISSVKGLELTLKILLHQSKGLELTLKSLTLESDLDDVQVVDI